MQLDGFSFWKVQSNVERLKEELPVLLANQAENYFVSSWRKNGWDGNQWAEVQRRMSPTKAYKYATPADRTRHILVKTGTLRRAVGQLVRSISFEQSRLVADVPYAGYLNDGTDKMPARPFMKDSPILREKQIDLINKEITKVWQI